ncbi:MAG: DUF2238 domain-containing protein, partial [Verrucomicrobiales bacterium]|nr:DUF2238 domain-containing protein [Verrucomicrobiales bacterium]
MNDQQIRGAFRNNRFLQALAGAYAIVWLVTAIGPSSRQDWFLENLLVFAAVPVLIVTYRRFQFSNTSYALVAVFLMFHAVGAHYTYSETPLGDWLRDALLLKRNHYDRIVHFAFGLLLAFPLREALLRAGGVRRGWSYAITVQVAIAWSGFYELPVGFLHAPQGGMEKTPDRQVQQALEMVFQKFR